MKALYAIAMSDQSKQLNALRTNYTQQRIGPYYAWNKVSRTQVWQWCAAMGDTNPLYLKNKNVVAPPSMLQSWTFRDVRGNYAPGSTAKNAYAVLGELGELGFKGTVAVSYDQTYHSYLSEGDHVHSYSTIKSISEVKTTHLGKGCFVVEFAEYYDQNEQLCGEATITYLQYKPPAPSTVTSTSLPKIERIRPIENHDSRHYWEGLRNGKLLLQQCSKCQTLRHPPQPMCEICQSLKWQTIESKCTGTIYSYTAIHYPEIPPFDYPNCIVLVDLDEGVRIAAQISDIEPDEINIGDRVQAYITEVQDGLSLPIFKVISA